MSITEGQRVTLERRGTILVGKRIGVGATASVYEASVIRTGERGVFKFFNSNQGKDYRDPRSRFLIDQQLPQIHPIFCAPTDIVIDGSLCGHFSPLINGKTLATYLDGPAVDFFECLEICISLAYALSHLHKLGIGHCDIHPENILLVKTGSRYRAIVIDFDNYSAPGQKPPTAWGHEHYMAPEQRRALINDDFTPPDCHSDRFSLAVIIHLLMLFTHPAEGHYEDLNGLHQVMMDGNWHCDPQSGGTRDRGLPSEMLNTPLRALFRRAFSLEPIERPSASKWARTLDQASKEVFIHEHCEKPSFIDQNTTTCPHCGIPFPELSLKFPGAGRSLAVRDEPKVVRGAHAICQRVGAESFVTNFGRQSLLKNENGSWKRLTDEQPIVIVPGDKLRFGDAECLVELVGGKK